jgi:demethylmenaquinone methyltransferase/2-methoxy-6-polyprenyl-1,4-benzoquinol methylase
MKPGRGSTPRGATSEQEAAAHVRRMFGAVAGRYDLLNHLLSFQVDRYWRARAVRRLRPILERPGARVLDLCCGTGDLLAALRAKAHVQAFVMGGDFCHPMLVEASKKLPSAPLIECDALHLPFADGSFDLITAAFGFRNLANYRQGLLELRRALKPGGTLAILEFSTPPNALFRVLYSFYSTRVLPFVGGLISGQREAYTYLPESVRKFPAAPELAREMEAAGFTRVEFRRYTFGIVALHTAGVVCPKHHRADTTP